MKKLIYVYLSLIVALSACGQTKEIPSRETEALLKPNPVKGTWVLETFQCDAQSYKTTEYTSMVLNNKSDGTFEGTLFFSTNSNKCSYTEVFTYEYPSADTLKVVSNGTAENSSSNKSTCQDFSNDSLIRIQGLEKTSFSIQNDQLTLTASNDSFCKSKGDTGQTILTFKKKDK